MPPYYQPPDHVPGDDLSRHFRAVVLSVLAVLSVTILWFALTTPDTPSDPPPPAQSLDQAGVTEHRLTLPDGRVLLCLSFPGPSQPVSCDWSRAYAR